MQQLHTLKDIEQAIATHSLVSLYIKAPICGVCTVVGAQLDSALAEEGNTRNGWTFPRADRTCMAAVLSRQRSRTDGPLHPSGTDEADIGKMDKSSRKRTSVTGLSMFQTAVVLIMMQVVRFLR